jgi:hypothetical protein
MADRRSAGDCPSPTVQPSMAGRIATFTISVAPKGYRDGWAVTSRSRTEMQRDRPASTRPPLPKPSAKSLRRCHSTPGTFAARVRSLAGRLRAWHDDPFAPPITPLATGDPAVALKNRETFRAAARPYAGRPEPGHHSTDTGEPGGDERSTDRAATLWLVSAVARQLEHAPHGVVWDYLRGLIESLLDRPVWTTVVPPQDPPPLAFLAQRGRVVVVGRPVDEVLLRGLEEAVGRILLDSPDRSATVIASVGPSVKKKRKGRPPEDDDEARQKKKLFLGWEISGLTVEEYLRKLGRNDEEGRLDLDAGRKRVTRERAKSGKKSSG